MNKPIEQPAAPPAKDLRIVIRPLARTNVPTCIISIKGPDVDPLLVAETLRLRGWSQRPWGIGLIVQARAGAIETVLRAAGFEAHVADALTMGGKAA